MQHRQRRPISFGILAAVIAVFLTTPNGFAQAPPPAATAPPPPPAPPPAPSQSLTAEQLQKINGWIASQGRDVTITPFITDMLGLTQNNQTITSHAFGAVDPDTNDIRHIYVLPDGKGYLIDYFHQQIVEVYWMDKDLTLITALSGIRGQPPAPINFQQAQFGFGNEMGWWAKYADAH